MSAEMLREAASVLRERAEAITEAVSGPWAPQIAAEGFREASGVTTDDGDHYVAFEVYDDDCANFMATMTPAVGLALADWLMTAGADLWAYGPLCCDGGCHECDDDLWAPHVRSALKVAAAILGRSS